MRTYFHVDMDAFFVSVEELFDPSLKGKPVVVGGQANQRGVVSAASYAARKFGVHSAMPLRTAYRLCPQAIFVDGHPERYRDYSRKVYQVLKSFSPQVEMASVDEAYMDLTGTERLHGPPLAAAHGLHRAVKHETQLNCSIGIAAARMVAKVASDQAKPNGILWVLPGQEARFLAPLDIRKIPGVGKVTEKNLQAWGIRKVGDLAATGRRISDRAFRPMGTGAGREVARSGRRRLVRRRGGRGYAIRNPSATSSRSTRTPPISTCWNRRSRGFPRWSAAGCASTGCTPAPFSSSCAIPTSPPSPARTRSITPPSSTPKSSSRSRALFRQNRKSNRAVRLLGVHASGLEPGEGQLNLLDEDKTERWRKALSAVDQIRDKFGEDSVSLATGLKGRFRERVHENPAGLPGKTPREDGALPDEGKLQAGTPGNEATS